MPLLASVIPVPDHVPPLAGANPANGVMPALAHSTKSGPASATTGATTVTSNVSLAWQLVADDVKVYTTG
jgi:hypothetical protein